MIERSKTKAKNSKRDRAARANKKRRLKMEGLEARQLLAANIFLPDVDLDLYDGPRNVGSVQALQLTEREQITQSGQNDVIAKAELIPRGNGPGQSDTIDLRGSMQYSLYTSDFGGINVDIDTFAFDLKAGDVLDIATLGTAGTIDLFDEQESSGRVRILRLRVLLLSTHQFRPLVTRHWPWWFQRTGVTTSASPHWILPPTTFLGSVPIAP